MMRSLALALLVLVGTVALGYGAGSLMEASSDPDDPCIGCGLVLLFSIAAGITGAVVVFFLTRRPRGPGPR